MKLIERVNEKISKKLKAITFTQYKTLYLQSTNRRVNDDEEKESDLESQHKILKDYLTYIIESNNSHEVRYGFVDGKKFGRLQSKNNSLQRIFNGFRGILCDGITYDLDMKNCHPNILKNLCDKHKIECKKLVEYINNREQWLDDLMSEYKLTRCQAKSALLKCINKSETTKCLGKKIVKNKDFIEFDKETSNIIDSLYNFYEKEFEIYVKNETYNKKGKLVNLLLCKIENEYLQKAIQYLTKQNIEICTLMFDGCMIYKNEDMNIEKIIKELDKLFKSENIKWTFKEHNTELLEKLESLETSDIDTKVTENIIEMTDHILNGILKDRIYKDLEAVYLITEYKIITKDTSIKSELYKLFSKQDYTILDKEKSKPFYIQISKIHSRLNQLIDSVILSAPLNIDFVKSIWENTLHKLYFNNGYYDFKLKKFVEGVYNMTFKKINKNYTEERDDKAKAILFNKVLDPVFTIDSKEDEERIKLRDYFIYRISRVMAGDITDKVWILFQGLRNCGKGVISDLIMNSFGEYVKVTNSENFILKKSLSSDASKSNSWIMDYEFTRLAITQEITINDNEKVNGNMIKKFCSGGDPIEGRKNFKDEQQFKIQSGLMICCNDIPEITPNDAMEFCDEFQMKSKFIDKDFDETKKLKTFKYYLKEDEVKTKIITNPDIINEFIHLVIEAYNLFLVYPAEIKKENQEVEDEDDTTKLFELFKITGNNKDRITNERLKQIVQMNSIPFTLKKVKMLLRTLGTEEFRSAKEKGITNLIYKEDEDEEEEKPKRII
jgi:hypothetical protein